MFAFSFGDLPLLRCVAIVLVVISGYLLLDFPHVYHAKTSSFCSFPDKNFATDPKIEQKTRKAWYLRHSRKNATKKEVRTINIEKRKHRNVVLLTKSSRNTVFSCCRLKDLPNINDTPLAAARRTCYLVVVVVDAAVVVAVVVVVVAAVVVVVCCRCCCCC